MSAACSTLLVPEPACRGPNSTRVPVQGVSHSTPDFDYSHPKTSRWTGILQMTTERQDEFQRLLEPVLDSAFGMAMSYTGGREADAEDLLQDAALKAYRGFASFEKGTNFKAWFFRILMNTAVSSFRKTQRRPLEVDIDDAAASPLLREATSRGFEFRGTDPAKTFVERIRLESIQEAIAGLPDEFRQVCILYFLEEFTYPEIAEVLEIPVGTVRSRLHRARKALQRHLLDIAVEDGILSAPSNTGTDP